MKFKRFFILFICVLMVTAMMPLSAIADDQAKGGGSHFLRIAGKNRYDTSMFIAHEWLNYNSGYSFDNVILASGTDFPDALGSSGPANETFAPIILVDNKNLTGIAEYVKTNLASGGYVYIMGGNGAVPAEMETELVKAGISKENIVRLKGKDRYQTNLAVLDGYSSINTLVVCSGKDYADALSASAIGEPILLVGDTLTDEQLALIADKGTSKFLIVGGTGAVSSEVEAQLQAIANSYGSNGFLHRVSGKNRYETSKAFAEFVWEDDSESAVFACGNNFPDGLSGATLCFWLGGPMILATSTATSAAAECVQNLHIEGGFVLGGTSLISDEAMCTIFGFED
jgi:putative cell wall-binding protein